MSLQVGSIARTSVAASCALFLSACASQPKTPGVAGSETVKPDYVREVVKSRSAKFTSCYEATIDKRPGAMGKARVSWDIDADGDVKNAKLAEVDPSLVDIEECLIHEVSELHFDRSKLFQEDATATDLVEVSYPFYFDERQSFTPSKLNPAFNPAVRKPAPGSLKEGTTPPIAPPLKNPTEK